MPPAAVLVLLALLPPSAAEAAAGRWRWPVRGEVVTPFHTTRDPYAAGQHRGIDIAARPGAPVRAACTGTVRFAGRLPNRGRGVTIACGPLVATHLELASTVVRRGHRAVAGMPIGTARASHVQLGARRDGARHGYVDPLKLLGEDPPPPLGPAPARGPRRIPLGAPRPTAAPAPRALPRPRSAPAPVPPAARRRPVPAAAWLGLALLAAATPTGALVRRERRRRRRAAAPAPDPA